MCSGNCVFGCCSTKRKRRANIDICILKTCRFAYSHYYDGAICGPVGGSNDQPKPANNQENTTVNDTINVIATEEPLADWEKELLAPNPNQVIHMYPAEGMSACDIKLDDGKTHAVNGNIQVVSCGDCRINYLTYANEQLTAELAKAKEKARVAEQATGMVRSELRTAQIVNGRQTRDLRRLREEVDYLRGRSEDPYRLHRVDRYGNRY